MFGIDLIPEMVAAARREASRLGLENVTFDVASADQLPFAPDTFDAALNRFGVMFFPSPMDAVRDMLRVLKPGRKLALAVWHFADRNPFHCSLSRVVDRFIDPPPVAPDAPDAFRFATPGQLLEICDQAGVVSPVERVLAIHNRCALTSGRLLDAAAGDVRKASRKHCHAADGLDGRGAPAGRRVS